MWFAELMVLSVAIIGVMVGIALLSSSRPAYWYLDKTVGEFMTAVDRFAPPVPGRPATRIYGQYSDGYCLLG